MLENVNSESSLMVNLREVGSNKQIKEVVILYDDLVSGLDNNGCYEILIQSKTLNAYGWLCPGETERYLNEEQDLFVKQIELKTADTFWI